MKLSRRDFLVVAMAAGAAPVAAAVGQIGDMGYVSLSSSAPLDLVICDDRFREGMHLASSAAQHGIDVRTVRDDVTQLWYEDLYYRWQANPGAIAGVTTVQTLFCLETLGADADLRLFRSSISTHSGLLNARSEPMLRSPPVKWLLAPRSFRAT